jgi:hypothetical protein
MWSKAGIRERTFCRWKKKFGADPQGIPTAIATLTALRALWALWIWRSWQKKRAMRGIVLNNHYEPSASLAYMTRKAVPGVEIVGGLTLILTVGGMNPHAVDYMAGSREVRGGLPGWGRLTPKRRLATRNTPGRLCPSPAMENFHRK